MGVVAADGAGIGAHRDRLQAHALIGAQVADHVAVVGVDRGIAVDVEIVAVLHIELAPPHHAETRADLVTELPLDVVKSERQVLVTVDMRPEDVGDQLFVGGAIQHVAPVPVGDAQHLFAVIVIAPALAPQIGRLQRRHQHRDMARANLFLVHDGLDLFEHLEAQGQPGIDAGGSLLDHARAQHQAMAGDLRLGGRLFQDRQEVAGKAHFRAKPRDLTSAPSYVIGRSRTSAALA